MDIKFNFGVHLAEAFLIIAIESMLKKSFLSKTLINKLLFSLNAAQNWLRLLS